VCVIDIKTRKVLQDCGKCNCSTSSSSGNHDWRTSIPESKEYYCSKCFTPK
jgi:hypothetical protein